MYQIWRRHGWLRPMFTMLAWADILFPETGRDVPVSLTIEPDGQGGDIWRRTFAFARERRFTATMVYEGSDIIERLGRRGMLQVPWHLRVQSSDAIQITTGETRVRIAGLRLRFPRWLRFKVDALQRARPPRREAIDAPSPEAWAGSCLDPYRPWFYAAAGYNVAWGTIVILWPSLFVEVLRIPPPHELAIWQALGMMVLVYAPAYWWVARDPVAHRHLVMIALLGKILGPLGFLWGLGAHTLPLVFGLTILTNDCLWWPAFTAFLVRAARFSGGWRELLRGG
jgi:Domain of unknown function (DUF4166)